MAASSCRVRRVRIAGHDRTARVKSRALRPIHPSVAPVPGHDPRATGAAWALSFLSTLAGVAFAMGAIAGWVLGLWPATPLTLGVATTVVVGGPLLGALFRGSARAPAPPPRPPVVAAAPPRPHPLPPLTAEQAYARELLDWRDRPRSR